MFEMTVVYSALVLTFVCSSLWFAIALDAPG